MQSVVDALVINCEKNREYGMALTAHLADADFLDQLKPDMNHPAWILSHLNLYHEPVVGIIRARPFDDPKDHRFGMNSKPSNDPSVYKTPAELRVDFDAGHRAIEAALREEGQALLERDVVLPRWKAWMPSVPAVLMYLIARHEAVHLGQLSAWRRVRGLPSV